MCYNVVSVIPKHIFFLWLKGAEVPTYAKAVIDAYQLTNPMFEVTFIVDDITDPQVEDVKIAKHQYLNWHNRQNITAASAKETAMKSCIEHEMRSYSGTYSLLSDNIMISLNHILRVFFVYFYGGIFLDLDTFPVKPFDSWLLSESFQSFEDHWWLGGQKGTMITNNDSKFQSREIGKYMKTAYHPISGFEPYCTERFYMLKEKFLNSQLTVGKDRVLQNYNGKDYYVDHYHTSGWKTISH